MEVKIKPGLLWICDEQPISFKPAHYTMNDSVEQALKLCLSWRWNLVKFDLIMRTSSVNAIEYDHMEVDIKVQSRAKVLH